MTDQSNSKTLSKRIQAWSVHAFTASGAIFGLFSLQAIAHQQWVLSLWLMCATVIIDAVDGTFARLIHVKEVMPEIDGALLDNIVDFLNYTIVPAFFLLNAPLLPSGINYFCLITLIFASAYQFTQSDAKTEDHFFKGFPSYWNIVAFYLFFWQTSIWFNAILILVLSILSFVPIKYIYPSRLDYLTPNPGLRTLMALCTLLWGFATMGLLWLYPATNRVLVVLSFSYILVYVFLSLYRTYHPMRILQTLKKNRLKSENPP